MKKNTKKKEAPQPENPKPEKWKLPEVIKYNGVEYRVKQNTLGVGRRVDALITPLKDSLLINPYWTLKLPEYEVFAITRHNMTQVAISINDMTEEMNLKTTPPARRKELEGTIKKAKGDLAGFRNELNSPVLKSIEWRINEAESDTYRDFLDNEANFAEVASILLIGDIQPILDDISALPSTGASKELVALRDELFRVFFSLADLTQKLLMTLLGGIK